MDIREMIQQSLDYIEENIMAQLSVKELCSAAGYSYVHYCRLFKHYTGFSPTEYITRRKLLHALYDISNGSSKIDAALNYGFETYSGFYKAFKREFECSPSDFTKSYNGVKPYKINILQEEHILISKAKIKKILKQWNFDHESVTNIYNKNTGRQNENAYYIGTDYIIKFSANIAAVNSIIDITKTLKEQNIPIAEIIQTSNNTDYTQDGELYFIVMKRIKGEHLKYKDFLNSNICCEIGKSIAKLHIALQEFDHSNYNNVNIYNTVCSKLPQLKSIINLSNKFVENYMKDFGTLYDRLPKQLVHRDINPSNMIFDKDKFKGFIDFDLAEVNVRIFDICYCATSILSEYFKDYITNSKWSEIFNNIVTGYNGVNPLSTEEKQALPYVIYSIQIICIAYFSQYDKYDDLTERNIDMLNYIFREELQ